MSERMSERMVRSLVDSITELMRASRLSSMLVEEMGAKLAELMGQKAFEEWFAHVREEAAIVAMAEVDLAKRIAEEKAGVTFKEVFGEEETFS